MVSQSAEQLPPTHITESDRKRIMNECYEDTKKCYELAKQVLDCQEQANDQMRIYEVYLQVLNTRKQYPQAEEVMNDFL